VDDEMVCGQCGAEVATQPHRCEIDIRPDADAVDHRAERSHVGTPTVEERKIFIDLADLDLPWQIQTFDDRSTIVSHIYERFVPYADEGWVWVTLPSDPAFADWVYGERHGRVTLEGANLLSRRVSVEQAQRPRRAAHPVSLHRLRQLAQRPWTAEPASKAWRRLEPS
jgi:hypothetical protein